jgi:hypothetical protein
MRTKSFFLLSIFACLLAIPGVYAQRDADVTVSYQQDIENILLDPLSGQIIVKELDKVSCYNPETNKTEWEVTKAEIGEASLITNAQNTLDALASPDLLKILESRESVELIPESPFVIVTLADKDAIINISNGKIVFNSAKTDYRITRTEFLFEENALLFIATDGKVFNCIWYDLVEGKEKWITKLSDVASFAAQFAASFALKGTSVDKVMVTNDEIYTSINGNLYKLAKTDGTISWATDYKINQFFLSQSAKSLIIIKNSGKIFSSKKILNILNASDGSTIWKDDLTTKSISYIEDWADKILIAHNSGFNFFNYADGKKIWKKDAKGSDIKRVIAIDKDYLYITGKEMNLIDQDGQNKWKKTIEISDDEEDAVYFLDKVENNRVFYLTATYGNMVDYSSGKKIWKKNIQFDKDKPLLYAQDEKTGSFLVYNEKKIYKFNPNATDKPEPVAKLKEIKEDKTISGIELFDWGICLTGQSDVIGVTFDGNTLYHNIYKEPGGTGRKLMKVSGKVAAYGLKGASEVSKAEIDVYSVDENGKATYIGTLKFNDKIKKAGRVADASSTAISSTLLSRVSDRFNALKQNANYAFVLDKGDESPVLIKVKKADGTEVDKIAIDNKKPIYEVDPVTDNIYYVSGKDLKIFSKK